MTKPKPGLQSIHLHALFLTLQSFRKIRKKYRKSKSCPVSALLFAISLEPLAQKIRLSKEVKQIVVKDTDHNISLYADDLLLYLDEVPTTLPKLLNIFTQFSSISGYKINLNKSCISPLNSAMVELNLNTELQIVQQFKYLGIDIYASLDTIVATNYKIMYNN